MAQTVVPKFYSTKKRVKGPVKNAKSIQKEKLESILKDPESTFIAETQGPVKNAKTDKGKLKTVLEDPESTFVGETHVPVKNAKTVEKAKLVNVLKDPDSTLIVETNKPVKKPTKSRARGKKVNKITNYLTPEPERSKAAVSKEVVQEKCEGPRTPKRNLPSPEELTPSKKKPVLGNIKTSTPEASPSKPKSSLLLTPQKQDSAICKKLVYSPNRYGSPKKFGSPQKKDLTPQKAAVYENLSNRDLASIVNESRSKILFSGRLDELKKSLETFSNLASKTKEFQSNSYKITSVISSDKSSDKEKTAVIKGEPAYKKFSYLTASKEESSLVLPYKYKLLGETFRCLDTVVRMINNRKEKITFEKVKGGVQDMLKKNFLKDHLGQIMTVFPTAYSLQYEKCESYTINKRTSPYQLIITANLDEHSTETSSKADKNNNDSGFVYMTPQHLLQRRYVFEQNLMKIVKKHHEAFLKRKNFPAVPDEKIVRWHPDFPVDSVPSIPVGALPEEPDVKVHTAKDVLNKIKGSFRGRLERALQSVADEHKSDSKEISTPKSESEKNTPDKKQNSALKGICTDLLEKIRARESAKIIETMTRSASDEKRLAMLEKLPKIVNILWHYFISERKTAVPVDVAVDKIIHSFNSLITPVQVKEHLDLIRETMPGWMSYIKITKGEYITIDKKKDINVMLSNIK